MASVFKDPFTIDPIMKPVRFQDMRFIDAVRFEKELRAMWLDLHGRRPPLKHPVTLKKIRTLLKKQGEMDCIPVAWIKLQIREHSKFELWEENEYGETHRYSVAWADLIERWRNGKVY